MKSEGRYDRLLIRAVHGELERWGRWIESHAHFDGYPSANILETYIGSGGGAIPGHRILMLDMPVAIWATHFRVVTLSEALREAVNAWYVVRVKEDGTIWTLQEKCRRLRVDCGTLRRRVSRARYRIAGLPVDADVRSQVVSVAV